MVKPNCYYYGDSFFLTLTPSPPLSPKILREQTMLCCLPCLYGANECDKSLQTVLTAQTQHETTWCWRMSLCKIILTKLLTEFRFASNKWYMPLGGVFFSTNIESIGDTNTTATLQTKSMKGIQTPPKTEANVAYLQRCLSRAINTS